MALMSCTAQAEDVQKELEPHRLQVKAHAGRGPQRANNIRVPVRSTFHTIGSLELGNGQEKIDGTQFGKGQEEIDSMATTSKEGAACNCCKGERGEIVCVTEQGHLKLNVLRINAN
jgi:hypothetical protein